MISAVNAVRAARHNRVLILEAVQRAGGISRSRLVDATGLTPATITNAVRELIELRLLRSTGEFASRRAATAGAPSELLALDGAWHRVLSIHQGVSLIRLGLHDVTGQVLASRELPGRRFEKPHAAVRRMTTGLQALLREQGVVPAQVRGVGVGAVGLVDPDTGTVRAAPNLGWVDVPLGMLLREALEWPVLVRNNVHAMAAGEVRFGGVPEGDAVYVYVGTGIGSGMIIGGRVHEGMHGAAGEIGHLVVPGGRECTCGKLGCLETVAAEPAVVRRASRLIEANLSHGVYKPAVSRLVELAAGGHVRATVHITRVAESLGLALGQVVEIMDPGAVILNGVITEAGDILLKPLAAALHRSAFAARGRSVAVRTARFGRQAGMVGAATLALDEYVYQPQSDLFAQRSVDRRAYGLALPA